MAKQSLSVIKNWFKTRLKPTQAQYWDTWDSFWHKDDKMPIDTITSLTVILDSKSSVEYVDNLVENMASKEYVDSSIFESADSYDFWKISSGATIGHEIVSNTLYNHYVVSDPRGIAPVGWRVPSKYDFKDLADFLGGNAIAGGKLKEAGSDHWEIGNMADNSSGFSAIGVGYRQIIQNIAIYFPLKLAAYFWNYESLLNDTSQAAVSGVEYNNTILTSWSGDNAYSYPKNYGISIRLIKEDSVDPGSLTDHDGNVYDTVKIGEQVWMKQNLMVKHFNDGTLIPEVMDDAIWPGVNVPAMCYWGNIPSVQLSENILINSHNLVKFKNTDTIEFTVNKLSDTEVEIQASTIDEGGDNIDPDNFWQKNETLPIDSIQNLNGILADKADLTYVESLFENAQVNLDIPDNSITYAKTGIEFKNNLSIAGNVIDWSTGMYSEITLTANTSFTFSNLEKGKSIIVRMNGAFVPIFPAACVIINGGSYNGSKWNSVIMTCVNSVTPKVLVSINTEPQ